MKKAITNPALETWLKLQDYLMQAELGACEQLYAEELRGRKRGQFLKRIHSRINKLRAIKERAEIEKVSA